LSLLDVQLSSLRAEEFTDYRLSGRNRPGFKSTAGPDYRDLCSAWVSYWHIWDIPTHGNDVCLQG